MLILIVLFFVVFATVFYLWIQKNQSYFKRNNVPYLKSIPLVGAFSDTLRGSKGIFDNIISIYNTPELKDEPFFGIFLFHKPTLFIKDPELIKRILVTDFNHFNNRYSASDTHDPLGYYQLFMVKNPLWKLLRLKLSSFFSHAKLKAAYYMIEKNCTKLCEHIDKKLENENRVELDVKHLTNLLFIDIIANIVFGIEADGLGKNGSEGGFQKAAQSLTDFTLKRGIEFSSTFLFPQCTKLFNFKTFGTCAINYIYEVIPQVISDRIKSGTKRNDLIDLMIELKSQNQPGSTEKLTDDMLYAQTGIFVFAGYETSSGTTSFTLYELSKQPDFQQRLRDEIKEMLVRHNGEIKFDVVANSSEMPLLNQAVYETLRLYPVLAFLDRECVTEGYSLEPYSDFKVPKGMPIVIPLSALVKDEKFFEDPLTYNPERVYFSDSENVPLVSKISFGTGPRNCIGERLGLIQVKTALIKVLKDFRVEVNANTPKNIKLVKKAFLIASENKMLIDFVRDPLI